MHDKTGNIWRQIWVLTVALPLVACAASMETASDISDTASFHAPLQQVLSEGVRVRVVVFGSDTLSGVYDIGRDGTLRLGNLGRIRAAGLTTQELEQKITALLQDQGQSDARVSVMVD